ncbi:unnamed protein product [Cochlearia groenlandica]
MEACLLSFSSSSSSLSPALCHLDPKTQNLEIPKLPSPPCHQIRRGDSTNAWLFVQTDEIPSAIKPYRSFQKERKLEDNDFSGAVFEGKFYALGNFKALETMHTRAEVYAKLLGTLQSPAINLVSTLQAPAIEVIMVLKACIKKLEHETNA